MKINVFISKNRAKRVMTVNMVEIVNKISYTSSYHNMDG